MRKRIYFIYTLLLSISLIFATGACSDDSGEGTTDTSIQPPTDASIGDGSIGPPSDGAPPTDASTTQDGSTTPDSGGTAQAPWPEWAFQHWVWEDESTQQSATDLVNDYLSHDIPVGAIIIDSPWETGYNTFEWDTSLFPDPQQMIDDFHAKNVRVMLWIVPAINIDVTDLYNEAKDKNYFMKKTLNPFGDAAVIDWWKGSGSMLDYFNPNAVDWWHALVDKALAYNIDGWKCDGLDFAVWEALFSPAAGLISRIQYSHKYYRDFFNYTRQKLGNDRIITARPVDSYGVDPGGLIQEASFAPVDINWAGWVGDQDPTFKGMRDALLNMYLSSKMGYVAFGSDIGGYKDDSSLPLGREKEPFIRWAQLGAFCPVMENGGSGEHRPWMFDQETTDIYRTFAKLHHAMIPYLMNEGAKAFASDPKKSLMSFFDKTSYAYLLGPDIFVTPMINAGTQRTVTFPQGSDWVYLFDKQKVHQGGTTANLTVPLSEFPVFLKKGSAIASTLTVP